MNSLILATAPACGIVNSITKGMVLDQKIKQLQTGKKVLQTQRINEKAVFDEALKTQKNILRLQSKQSSKFYKNKEKKMRNNYIKITEVGKLIDSSSGQTKKQLQKAQERIILQSLQQSLVALITKLTW